MVSCVGLLDEYKIVKGVLQYFYLLAKKYSPQFLTHALSFTIASSVMGFALSSCSKSNEENSSNDADSSSLLDPDKKLIAAKVISSFENSTIEIQYAYAENINDGRGITAGRAGFTSGTGDLLLVVENYTQVVPDNDLASYITALEAVNGTDSTDGLDGFIEAWEQAATNDSALRQAQDDLVDELYFNPALVQAGDVGVESSLGQLIFWDTITQHGEGEDPDGLPALIQEILDDRGPVNGDESDWLSDFLSVRKEHLENAADPDTQDAWHESAPRVDALRSFLEDGNLDLTPPLVWTVYGDTFELGE